MITLKIEYEDENERFEFIRNLKDDYLIVKQGDVFRLQNSEKKSQSFEIVERLKMKPYKPWRYD